LTLERQGIRETDDDAMMATMQLAADSFELELAGDDLQLFNNMAAGLLGSPHFTLGAVAARRFSQTC